MSASSRGPRGALEYVSWVLREHAESLLLALVLGMVIRWFVLSSFAVRSDAMSPTLLQGDIVLGFRPPYGMVLPMVGRVAEGRGPRRGDLAVLRCGKALCLKRILGVPGDRVEMVNQRLLLNSRPCQYEATSPQSGDLTEKCLSGSWGIRADSKWEKENWGPTMVPPGEVFVLNDNRVDREDSRTWGPIPIDRLEAQTVAIWLSLNWGASNDQSWVRWTRSFTKPN